jgi:hypothetical protein
MESPAPTADDRAQDDLWAAEAKGALRQSAAVGVADAWGDERPGPSARSAGLLPETFAAGPVKGRFGRKGKRSQPRQPEPQPEPDDLDLGPEVHSGRRLDLDMEPFEPAPFASEANAAKPEPDGPPHEHAPAVSFEPASAAAPEPATMPVPEPASAAVPAPVSEPASAPVPEGASTPEPLVFAAPPPLASAFEPAQTEPAPPVFDPLDDLAEPAPPAAALAPAPLAPALPVQTSPAPAGVEPSPEFAPVAPPGAPALTGWDTLFEGFDTPSEDLLAGPASSTAPDPEPPPAVALPTVPVPRPAADANPDADQESESAAPMPPIWGKHPDEQSPEKPPIVDPW